MTAPEGVLFFGVSEHPGAEAVARAVLGGVAALDVAAEPPGAGRRYPEQTLLVGRGERNSVLYAHGDAKGQLAWSAVVEPKVAVVEGADRRDGAVLAFVKIARGGRGRAGEPSRARFVEQVTTVLRALDPATAPEVVE